MLYNSINKNTTDQVEVTKEQFYRKPVDALGRLTSTGFFYNRTDQNETNN